MPTRAELLAHANAALIASGLPPADATTEARVLLLHALNISRETLLLNPGAMVQEPDTARFTELIHRRARREPLAYLIGTRLFYGLDFVVTPAVLIPRPETEFLVEAVLAHLSTSDGGSRIADIGTGSGCIAVAVAVHAPGATVYASDISADALTVAQENVRRHGLDGRVHLRQGDLLAPLAPFAPFAAIVSNPPYIAPSVIEILEPEVRVYEPRLALGTDPDPLHLYRRIVQTSPPLLAPGGLLAVEVGQGQAETVAGYWEFAGLVDVAITNDYAGIGRVVRGRKRDSV